MIKKVFLQLNCLLIALLAFGCGPEIKNIGKVEIVNGAIVGGAEVDPLKTNTAYIVSLGGECAGSIIAPKWILTAAHCEEIFNLPITGGSFDLLANNRIRLSVKNYYIHPNHRAYGFGDSYDFALIELSAPIDFAKTKLSSIKLADPEFEASGGLNEGVVATVLGWGATWENASGSSKLRQVDLPIVSNERANAKDSYNGVINESMLVAGQDQGLKDACQGDSGGPLTVKNPATGTTLLAGVVSFGKGCARPKWYGVYSRVSSAYDWIMETIN